MYFHLILKEDFEIFAIFGNGGGRMGMAALGKVISDKMES